jgi:hypothetical protein
VRNNLGLSGVLLAVANLVALWCLNLGRASTDS